MRKFTLLFIIVLLIVCGHLATHSSWASKLAIHKKSYVAVQQKPVVENNIWATIGLKLTLGNNVPSSEVQKQIRIIQANKAKFTQILKASEPYIYYIYTQTQQKKLPAELALIPVVESEYSPYDHSTPGATGLWQLMPGTAHIFGIKTRNGYDGRRNVVLSTKAALGFFHDLGQQFHGNWLLAIAAYNSGQGTVGAAVRRAGTHDFWSLRLPKETRVYIPKLLAVAAIIKNPQKYGIQLPPISNKPYFTEVQLNKSMSLNQVSKQMALNIKTLTALNPDYRNRVIPNKTEVLVPVVS